MTNVGRDCFQYDNDEIDESARTLRIDPSLIIHIHRRPRREYDGHLHRPSAIRGAVHACATSNVQSSKGSPIMMWGSFLSLLLACSSARSRSSHFQSSSSVASAFTGTKIPYHRNVAFVFHAPWHERKLENTFKTHRERRKKKEKKRKTVGE